MRIMMYYIWYSSVLTWSPFCLSAITSLSLLPNTFFGGMGIVTPLVYTGTLYILQVIFTHVPLETHVVQQIHCNDVPPGNG